MLSWRSLLDGIDEAEAEAHVDNITPPPVYVVVAELKQPITAVLPFSGQRII